MQTQQLYEQVVEELRDRLVSALGPGLRAIVLYGSVVREQANTDSDIDVLIIGDVKGSLKERIYEIRDELMERHGYAPLLMPIYLTPEEFENGLERGEPLLINILKEGKPLYDTGLFAEASQHIPHPQKETVEKYLQEARRRLDHSHEHLEAADYVLLVQDAYKAAFFAAEGLMLAQGHVPKGRGELARRFKQIETLQRLSEKADRLEVGESEAAQALSLTEVLVGKALKVYEKRFGETALLKS